jgi:hypothetical protein
MQHDKITKNIEQIEKVSSTPEEITDNIQSVMNKFGISKVINPLNGLKRSGTAVSATLTALIILPFVGKDSIWSYFVDKNNPNKQGAKDSYYNIKNKSDLNWRILLYGMAKRFIYLFSKEKQHLDKQIKALILDDTTGAKTGKHIEGAGYVHDHTTGSFIFGYKILVSGYWDGISFIPLDFSIHREKRDGKLQKIKSKIEKQKRKLQATKHRIKELEQTISERKKAIKELRKTAKLKPTVTNQRKLSSKENTLARKENQLQKIEKELGKQKQELQYLTNLHYEQQGNIKKYGLTKKELKNQFKKQRERNSSGYKRKKELDVSKIDSAVSMIKRAITKGFTFEYVLTDSWFFCEKLLSFITKQGGLHLVSMAKIGKAKYKILPEGKYYAPAHLIKIYQRKAKTNRKYKARYIRLQAEYQGERVVMFLVNIGSGNNWRLLVSTELNITFNKLMDVYKIRWSIEVFFKEVKQHLLFSKSQSRDFDGQIADISLSFIRYILLSFYERTHYGMTIGGLFKKLSQAAVEENVVADLSSVFMELLEILAQFTGINFMEFYHEMIANPDLYKKLTRLGMILKPEAA